MDRTNAERQRRYVQRLKDRAAGAVSNGAPDTGEVVKLRAEVARLKDELYHVRMENMGARFAPKPRTTKPKAEKAPLPPDEERDRIIKGLKTRVRNLTAELQSNKDHMARLQNKTGAMDFVTMAAIAKVLHPDLTPTEEQRAEACRLFTQWKADKDKARRAAR